MTKQPALPPEEAPPPVVQPPPEAPEEVPVDETADWKPYVSQTGKFTLKYPSEWDMGSEGTLTTTGTESIFFGPRLVGGAEDPNIRLSVGFQRPNPDREIVDAKTAKDSWMRYNGQNIPGLRVTTTSLAGREGFKIEYEWGPSDFFPGESGLKIVRLFIDNGGLIYHLSSIFRSSEPFDVQIQTFQQILSTFRFLE